MDRIPNELLQQILNFAMLSKIPFCIDNFLDASKWATKYRRGFDSFLDPSQLPTLRDWRLIVGTSRRFRQLGKEAFFSHKTIVMDPDTVDLLQTSQLKPLSVEDQGIMIKYTNSIVFPERTSESPSSLLRLSRRIAPFPHLQHIGILFGYRKKEPLELLIEAVQEGRPAPDHLPSAVASMGVPVDKIQVTLMVWPSNSWDMHVADLQRVIYPVIRIAAKARGRKSQPTSD
ncbi:hypothetical protein G7Y79_00025g057510 [Physcia stellaris]|nr:hypothetical protein G7Y79_00025g057510 [Physcia stellaris]